MEIKTGEMETQALLTSHQRKIIARNSAVYKRWKELTSNPANSKMEIYKLICKEFDIESHSTVWSIVKRMEGSYNAAARRKGGEA